MKDLQIKESAIPDSLILPSATPAENSTDEAEKAT